jgi:hypothetical protein
MLNCERVFFWLSKNLYKQCDVKVVSFSHLGCHLVYCKIDKRSRLTRHATVARISTLGLQTIPVSNALKIL